MMELLATLENSGFGTWLRESPSIWAYPAVLTLHTLGLGVLVGGNPSKSCFPSCGSVSG
jgi:hypothetical protein